MIILQLKQKEPDDPRQLDGGGQEGVPPIVTDHVCCTTQSDASQIKKKPAMTSSCSHFSFNASGWSVEQSCRKH
jgi:hypothetical protein